MYKSNLSVVMIGQNVSSVLSKSLESVRFMSDDIIYVDDYSIDNSVKIAKKYKCRVYLHESRKDLGKQREWALRKARNEWILLLDADERVSEELARGIISLLHSIRPEYIAFRIRFINHFLGKPLYYGGEQYKMIRLFRKSKSKYNSGLVHEKMTFGDGKIGYLNEPILHYSYRSLWQMYCKFTDYAIREAEQKARAGEKSSLKKIFMYPVHMVWARFVKDEGYKDGLFRLPLDIGFGYMEFLTYLILAFK